MGSVTRDVETNSHWKSSVDRGWAWMCLLGVFLVNMIVIGTFKSFGILYVEAMEMFQTSAGQTAWIFTCVGITNTLLPTPAAALSNRFGNRAVVVIGGVVFACGSMFTTFASNIVQMTFIFGLFTGAGIGLVYANSMAMIPKYFVRRRAIASGLAVSGSSVGQFVVPPLLRYLMDTFGFRGAMLVYGAFLLNVCLCGSIFRPLMTYKPVAALQEDIRSEIEPVSEKTRTNGDTMGEATGNDVELKLLTKNGCSEGKESFDNETPEYQIKTTENTTCVTETDNITTKVKNSECKCPGISLDFSLFREAKFLIYLLGTWFATFGYSNSFIIIPPHAKQLEIDKQETAFLLILIGAGDFIGRVGCGFYSDTEFVKRLLKRHHIYLINIGIVGVAHILCPLAVTHTSLAVYCAVLGIFGGGFIALMVVVLADWVGANRINSAMGFTVMVQGFGNTITPIILGQLRDVTGDYAASFRFCGSAMVVGSLVFLIGPYIASRLKKRHES